ncbi:SMN complex subunit smn1 [Cladobotryum mycophilum]|uniref:SMN complex subunit smn1 n=1 Tax=Cladobotryum mycophilum TaxID=491253 RepID=A0ABR0SB06_9HYPO
MDLNLADPSNEEVWDDSMLIDSWNQALEEYKKYHSIHAKGGTLKDLEKEDSNSSKKTGAEPHNTGDQGQNEVDAENKSSPPTVDQKEKQPTAAENKGPQQSQTPSAMPMASPHKPFLVQVIRDENLKKLLMSWYYAGYYTGLYEGQQQAQQPQP